MNSKLFIRIDHKLKKRAMRLAKEKNTDISKWVRMLIEMAVLRADRKKNF